MWAGWKDGDQLVDEVVVGIFVHRRVIPQKMWSKFPVMVPVFIQQQVLCTHDQTGARMAKAGEFTMRAFYTDVWT